MGARRSSKAPSPVRRALQPYLARRNLETLAANLGNPGKTLAQIGPLLAGLPEDQGTAAALAIGNLYARQGQWPLAGKRSCSWWIAIPRIPCSRPIAG